MIPHPEQQPPVSKLALFTYHQKTKKVSPKRKRTYSSHNITRNLWTYHDGQNSVDKGITIPLGSGKEILNHWILPENNYTPRNIIAVLRVIPTLTHCSDILSGILSDRIYDILCDILSNMCSDKERKTRCDTCCHDSHLLHS